MFVLRSRDEDRIPESPVSYPLAQSETERLWQAYTSYEVGSDETELTLEEAVHTGMKMSPGTPTTSALQEIEASLGGTIEVINETYNSDIILSAIEGHR